MTAFLTADRCGQCDNCRHVVATGRIVLSHSAPSGPGIAQPEVELWNKTLQEHPCLNAPLPRDEWIKQFAAEYKRRTLLDAEGRGCSDEEMADYYYPHHSPADAVSHQIQKYDLADLGETSFW